MDYRWVEHDPSKSLGYVCHTVEELEPLALEWLRKYINLPSWPVGSLLPQPILKKWSSSSGFNNISKQRSLHIIWFTKRYEPFTNDGVSYRLENSRTPFIWVIRPPQGFDLRGAFQAEWLSEHFEERMSESNQGLLVKNWAPQLVILVHKSTGAFLSYCGWNSVPESLSQRSSNHWMTLGSRANLQLQDVGGGNGCLCRVDKMSSKCYWRGKG
ncbi:hypothetical protein PTKIN_Ptkin01aG0283600 [Pterospermum kingtungense]